MIRNFAAALALLSLAACGGSKSEDASSPASDMAAASEAASVAASGVPAPAASDSGVAVTIPDIVQGRWGLVPADCTSTKGDNKGLLTITPVKLQFYESVGTLTDVKELAPNHIRATFDFTGEGLEWTREQTLDVAQDGKTMTRRELGEDAAPGPFQYTRCS